MLTSQSMLHIVLLLAVTTRTVTSQTAMKYREGLQISTDFMNILCEMFKNCLRASMPHQRFLVDNLKNFVNYPSRTTVGFAPKYTSNRKFFANMISSTIFREMLEKDEEELKINMIKKLKYCDDAVMDQNILKDFYDREVDQSKI